MSPLAPSLAVRSNGPDFKCSSLPTVERPLSIYSTHRAEIQLVLLDMTMPLMDGDETSRQLRLIDPDVRIVMISGYNEQEVVRRFAGRELSGFIQKPFQPQALVAKLVEALES